MTRTELVQVVDLFAARYHGGQRFRGYRLLCRSKRWLARHGAHRVDSCTELTPQQTYCYVVLERAYADRL